MFWLICTSTKKKRFITNKSTKKLLQIMQYQNIMTECIIQILILFLIHVRLPLWSSGQSSWLQIQRFGFNSWRYQIFWEVVGLEIEELFEGKSSGSDLEIREYGRRDLSRWPRGTPLSAKGGTNYFYLHLVYHSDFYSDCSSWMKLSESWQLSGTTKMITAE
jgi:hypothetical protein